MKTVKNPSDCSNITFTNNRDIKTVCFDFQKIFNNIKKHLKSGIDCKPDIRDIEVSIIQGQRIDFESGGAKQLSV